MQLKFMGFFPTEDLVGNAYINCPFIRVSKGGERDAGNAVNTSANDPKTLEIENTQHRGLPGMIPLCIY